MGPKKIIHYKDKIFLINDGVYEPDRYSFFLEESICLQGGESILDLVTGSGFFAIMTADNASKVVGIDINPKSVRCAKMNAMINDVEDRTDFRVGNLFNGLGKDEMFDLIIANPPSFPTPANKARKDSFGVSNLAGPDGRALLDNVLQGFRDHLRENGRLLLWHAWYSNIPKTIDVLSSLGFTPQIISEKYFSVGLLSFERSEYLKEIGLPLVEVNGELSQYHVVINAFRKKL